MPTKTRPPSKLLTAALQQFFEDQDRRITTLLHTAAASDGIDLQAGWRFDLQAMHWVQQDQTAKKPAPDLRGT